MIFLAERRRCPQESSVHAVARLLCVAVLVCVCSVGHESSIAPAAAELVGRRTTSPSASTHHYHHSSGIPQVGKFGPSRTIAAWQLPSGRVKKVLIIFEDLYVQPFEFWDRSPSCPMCTGTPRIGPSSITKMDLLLSHREKTLIFRCRSTLLAVMYLHQRHLGSCCGEKSTTRRLEGLPEKRKIVSDAIARNYAVFIPHPLDVHGMREDGGWDTLSPNSPVVLNILFILAEWKGTIGLQDDVPTVALGVSTGGEILSTLGLLPGFFESIAMMISNGVIEAFESATQDYPPTIFIHMPKDIGTAAGIYYVRKLLSANRVPTKEVRWLEHCVTEDWFAQLIPGMNLFISRRINRHLKEEGWLDDKTGLLKRDSDFLDEWHVKVRAWNILPPDPQDEEFLMFEDSVLEELNVADAYHVTLARHNEDLFAWFEGGYKVETSGENAAMPLFAAI